MESSTEHNLAALLAHARAIGRTPLPASRKAMAHCIRIRTRSASPRDSPPRLPMRVCPGDRVRSSAQCARVCRSAVRLLVGGIGRRSRQYQTASARAGVRACRQRCAFCICRRCVGSVAACGGAGPLRSFRLARLRGTAGERNCGADRCRGSRRASVALLHQRNYRPAERRDHLARQPARNDRMLLDRCRTDRARRRHPARSADVARFGTLHSAACCARRRQRRAGVRRLRCGGSHCALAPLGARAVLRGADDGQASRCRAGAGECAARSLEMHRLRWRSDVCRGLQGRVRRARPAPRADLRSRRDADDDHRDGSCDIGRRSGPR